MLRLGLALAWLLVLALPPVATTTAGAADQPAAGPSAADRKISPWLHAALASGTQAEFLVVLGTQADLSQAAARSTKQAKGRYVYQALWQTAQATQGPLLAWLKAHHVEYRAYYIVNLVWVKGDAAIVQALAGRADVERIEANPLISNSMDWRGAPPARPVPAPAGIEPNISYVHAPDVWALGFTGQGIVIGSQDTGFDWSHPALKLHYRGWNGTSASHDYNWHDSVHTPGSSCGADAPAPCDDYGHGTHTLGTALGDDGGVNRIGMAPGAQWMGCRDMDYGVGTPATYLECFEFFLAPYPVGGTPAQGNPDLAPDVTNNSWGCPPSEGCSVNTLRAAVEAQRAAGIMTVASAGNLGPACQTVNNPPGLYVGTYTVGALNTNTDTIAGFSSRGPVDEDGSNRRKPDIAAPGTWVRSAENLGTYAFMSGTSMAAPHVTGAVALLWSARPALKNQVALTEQILDNSAVHLSSTDCGSTGWPNNTFGYGRLDVLAAVQSVPPETGRLTGVVTDTGTGTPIAGVAITATNHQTPTLQLSSPTSPSGVYTQTLPPGTYTVTTFSPAYLPLRFDAVSVVSGTTTVLDISMAPALHWFMPWVSNSAP